MNQNQEKKNKLQTLHSKICKRCKGEKVVLIAGGGQFNKIRCPKCKGKGVV
jgi:phage FluMu protein Com